jgi:hypothetical protein
MDDAIQQAVLRSALKSQYHSGLAMLRESIERCPDDLWLRHPPLNAFWQAAYHVIFFTHYYMQKDYEGFRPWAGHQYDNQNPDGIPEAPKAGSALPLEPDPYTRAQALAYWEVCDGAVDSLVDAMDLGRPDCGFPWYKISKLEHQLVNLRHLQHHAAQLADRLRAALDVGVKWVGAGTRD